MKNKKKLSLIILSMVTVPVLGLIFLNGYIHNQIEDRINNFFQSPSAYETLDIGFLGTSVELTELNYDKHGKNIKAQRISVKDINLKQYIFSDKIAIDKIEISEPSILVISGKRKDSAKQKIEFNYPISIDKLQVFNGDFRLKKSDTAANDIYFRFPEFSVSDIAADSSTVKEKIPFSYSGYSISGDSLRLNLDAEHFISVSNLYIKNGKVSVKNFGIIPFYDKVEFDRQVPYEKDRVSLEIDSIGLSGLSFKFKNDTLYLQNPMMKVSGGNLEVYRNRILPDDIRKKSLLNEKLRQLRIKLDFEKMEVTGSKIVYEEGTEREGGPARVSFREVNGSISNILNINLDRKDFPRTEIKANALFMNQTPLDVEISFNVTNLNNKFLFTGNAGEIPGRALNPFLIPARGIEAEGALQSVYFTFTGNEELAVGDVRVNYDRFKINLLEEGSRDEKEILTALANLLVDNDGHSGENAQKNIEVNRDKYKSIWNYMWSAVQKGIMESLKQL